MHDLCLVDMQASTTTQGLTKADFAPAKVPPLEATKTTTVSGIHSEISKMMTQRRTVDENRLGLRIFLPSKKTLEFSVPFSTTVHEAITEILRLTKQRDLEELMGNADCYELRLHDDDGEIDDDFPRKLGAVNNVLSRKKETITKKLFFFFFMQHWNGTAKFIALEEIE